VTILGLVLGGLGLGWGGLKDFWEIFLFSVFLSYGVGYAVVMETTTQSPKFWPADREMVLIMLTTGTDVKGQMWELGQDTITVKQGRKLVTIAKTAIYNWHFQY
jgi:hypothetical protein